MSGCLDMNPNLVAEATSALRAFHVEDRRTAQLLLSMWSRRLQLTDAEVAQVLAQYPEVGPEREPEA